MSDDPIDSDTRRRFLLATGGMVGLGALAGCAEEENGGEDGNGPTRPTPDQINADDLDPVLLFMVRSHDYQNKLLEREFGGE